MFGFQRHRGRWIALAGVLLLTACGYRPARYAGGAPPPAVVLEPFRERLPVGISGLLDPEIARVLHVAGTRLRRQRDGRTPVLRGEIRSGRMQPTPTPLGTEVASFRLEVQLDAWLESPEGERLWETRLTDQRDFLAVSASESHAALATEANRRRALQHLAEDLAQALVERLSWAADPE